MTTIVNIDSASCWAGVTVQVRNAVADIRSAQHFLKNIGMIDIVLLQPSPQPANRYP